MNDSNDDLQRDRQQQPDDEEMVNYCHNSRGNNDSMPNSIDKSYSKFVEPTEFDENILVHPVVTDFEDHHDNDGHDNKQSKYKHPGNALKRRKSSSMGDHGGNVSFG